MKTFDEFLEEQEAKKPNLKKLSDAANAATVAYRKNSNDATLKHAHEAHHAAYHAHLAQHKVKPLGNATYNRMREHGTNSDHYKSLMKHPH